METGLKTKEPQKIEAFKRETECFVFPATGLSLTCLLGQPPSRVTSSTFQKIPNVFKKKIRTKLFEKIPNWIEFGIFLFRYRSFQIKPQIRPNNFWANLVQKYQNGHPVQWKPLLGVDGAQINLSMRPINEEKKREEENDRKKRADYPWIRGASCTYLIRHFEILNHLLFSSHKLPFFIEMFDNVFGIFSKWFGHPGKDTEKRVERLFWWSHRGGGFSFLNPTGGEWREKSSLAPGKKVESQDDRKQDLEGGDFGNFWRTTPSARFQTKTISTRARIKYGKGPSTHGEEFVNEESTHIRRILHEYHVHNVR